jgi:ATP-dependent helicase/nuclease subunit B
VDKARRPSPRPPLAHRPDRLSVTDVQVLIRDPYEIYARRILRLNALDPLHKTPEPRDRGNVLHHVLERFIRERPDLSEAVHRQRLLELAAETLAEQVPWPTARRLWLARLARVAQHFLAEETGRAALANPMAFERRGQIVLSDLGFTLVAKADRIDLSPEGALYVYDYKTGNPPSVAEQKKFSKQLLLEAVIAERGGFAEIAGAQVLGAAYIGLGANPRTIPAPLAEMSTAQTLHELRLLIAAFQSEMRGYTAQLARQSERVQGDYDQLSRAGEWDLSETPVPEDVGR